MATDLAAKHLIALLAGREPEPAILDQSQWEQLVAYARRHSLAPFLFHRLKERRLAIPPVWEEPLRRDYLADNLPEALALMSALGYAAPRPFEPREDQKLSHHMPPLKEPQGLTVEMHWSIVNPRSPVRFTPADLTGLWLRAIPATIGETPAHVLAPTDLLLHLCLHASIHHRFDAAGLRNYVDIALTQQRYDNAIDWEQFIRHTQQWDITNGVYLALQLATQWTDFKCPPDVLPSLGAAPLDEETSSWLHQKILHGNTPALRSELAPLAAKTQWFERLAILRRAILLTPAQISSMYPVAANSWRVLGYYPVPLRDLWRRYRREVWQLVRRDKKFIGTARLEAQLRAYLGWE